MGMDRGAVGRVQSDNHADLRVAGGSGVVYARRMTVREALERALFHSGKMWVGMTAGQKRSIKRLGGK